MPIKRSDRRKILKHGSVEAGSLFKALDDPNVMVRYAAAGNPNATESILSKAIDDPNEGVRRAAAENPNATETVLSKALDNPYWGAKRAAVKNPNVNQKIMTKALKNEDYEVRCIAIARAADFGIALDFDSLSQDGSLDVRLAARRAQRELEKPVLLPDSTVAHIQDRDKVLELTAELARLRRENTDGEKGVLKAWRTLRRVKKISKKLEATHKSLEHSHQTMP